MCVTVQQIQPQAIFAGARTDKFEGCTFSINVFSGDLSKIARLNENWSLSKQALLTLQSHFWSLFINCCFNHKLFSLSLYEKFCLHSLTTCTGEYWPQSSLYGPRGCWSVLPRPRANIPQYGPRARFSKKLLSPRPYTSLNYDNTHFYRKTITTKITYHKTMMLRWATSCSKNQELRKKNFEDDVINNK